MGKKKSQSEKENQESKQQKLLNLIRAAKLTERKHRLEQMKDGMQQRAHTFKTPKDYNRKDKTWKKEQF
jgi:hypothetical protein